MNQYQNSVELTGRVGSVHVSQTGGTKFARIALATVETYRAKDGSLIEECTWTLLVCYQKEGDRELSDIKKGCALHVKGRLKSNRYTEENGAERSQTEVLCSSWNIIEEE